MSEAELLSEADVRTTTVKHPMAKRKGDPCTMVIFGGAGDLTKRKLIPALCNLAEQGFLPQQFAIIAVTYTDLTTETFRQQLSDDIKTFALRPVDPAICKRLVEHTYYVRGDFADPGTYERLKATLGEVATKENLPANYFFYLAVAPRFRGGLPQHLPRWCQPGVEFGLDRRRQGHTGGPAQCRRRTGEPYRRLVIAALGLEL